MKAMILAAGRGERMRPLTDHCPKPLLHVGGQSLIVWHIQALVAAGITNIVINHAHLGHLIEEQLGDGSPWGASIEYSPEDKALETAGGIAKALPLLSPNGSDPFLVINGDVFTDWPFERVSAVAEQMNHMPSVLAHLCLVPNPPQHPTGDFVLSADGWLKTKPINPDESPAPGEQTGTFSGIGVYRPALFATVPTGGVAPLAPLLRVAMNHKKVTGSWYDGVWMDIGTPERLNALDVQLKNRQTV